MKLWRSKNGGKNPTCVGENWLKIVRQISEFRPLRMDLKYINVNLHYKFLVKLDFDGEFFWLTFFFQDCLFLAEFYFNGIRFWPAIFCGLFRRNLFLAKVFDGFCFWLTVILEGFVFDGKSFSWNILTGFVSNKISSWQKYF